MTDDLAGSTFARSFGAEAVRYAQVRPSYPAASVDYALADLAQPQRILDLGAGTGKLTELLIGRAADVVAVEPDPSMLAQLVDRVPAARGLAGSAERIPLPDGSVDAILVGQAFHWFTRPAADREMARVLRPGGVVGLIWNFPDRAAVDWVRKLYEATRDPYPPGTGVLPNLGTDLFTSVEENWVSSSHPLAGPAGLRDLVQTWSWVITRPAAEQQAIDRRVRLLIELYPELQAPTVQFPHRTKTVRQYRR